MGQAQTDIHFNVGFLIFWEFFPLRVVVIVCYVTPVVLTIILTVYDTNL